LRYRVGKDGSEDIDGAPVEAAARLTAMREEIERKDEALRPFAHYCELNDLLDSGDPERAIEVPVSDLQRAYAVLTTDHKGTAP
jgi:hypothetical protein